MIVHDTPRIDPWLIKLAAPPAPTHRIVAFPSAGGTASSFRSWAACLPNGCELFAVQLPGRQKRTREPPLRQLGPAIGQILPAIAALGHCATTFVGDCMGAIIAYETIRAAIAQELPLPHRLVVSCCPAPHVRPRRRMMHVLPEEDLIADVTTHGLVPSWLLQDVATFKAFLPLLRCDYELIETYRHAATGPIAVPITVFAASEDTLTPRDDLSQWQCHTSREFDLIDVSGGHQIATAHPESLLRRMLWLSISDGRA
jgi:medium-chain acyl-[acyl-carrier-protein] hydrolase